MDRTATKLTEVVAHADKEAGNGEKRMLIDNYSGFFRISSKFSWEMLSKLR